jgi:hypothetical protein
MSAYADGKRQSLTRIPNYRRGDWVKLVVRASTRTNPVRQVRSLTCVVTDAETVARWMVHFTCGSPSVFVRDVLRPATDEEIERAERIKT